MTFFFFSDPGLAPTRSVALHLPLARKEMPAPEARHTFADPFATLTVADDPFGTVFPVISAICSAVRLTPTAGDGFAATGGVVACVADGRGVPAGTVTFGWENPGSSTLTFTTSTAAGLVAG